MYRRFTVATLLVLAAGLLVSGCQQGQSYPTRPIEYVVHAAAGGGTDIMARTVTSILTNEKLVPQSINVVNKVGGSGAVAAAYVAEKKGDPYTIYNATGVLVSTPIQTGSGYTQKDFTPVANLAFDGNCIVVLADSPYKTLKDLTDAAKPGKKMTQGGGSVTASEAQVGFLMKKSTGADYEYMSMGSSGEALTALMGGHVDFVVPSPQEAIELLRAGKVRVLAVTTDQRLDIWPEVPTMKELNIEYPQLSFRGLVMPPGVSADAVKYWQDTLQKMRATEAWKKYVKDNALVDAWLPGEQFGAHMDKFAEGSRKVLGEMGLLKK